MEFYSVWAPVVGVDAANALNVLARWGNPENSQLIMPLKMLANLLGTTKINTVVAITQLVKYGVVVCNRNPKQVVMRMQDIEHWKDPAPAEHNITEPHEGTQKTEVV
jgi:hypothetical protein